MKYDQITENPKTGWSDLIFPDMKLYKMACCDCGLVHDMKFYVYECGRRAKDGSFIIKRKAGKTYHVALKASRNDKATRQLRKRTKVIDAYKT